MMTERERPAPPGAEPTPEQRPPPAPDRTAEHRRHRSAGPEQLAAEIAERHRVLGPQLVVAVAIVLGLTLPARLLVHALRHHGIRSNQGDALIIRWLLWYARAPPTRTGGSADPFSR